MNQMPAVYTDTCMELRRITERFMETGFAFIPSTWSQETILLHSPMVSKYMRRVARELKRPFIRVEMWRGGNYGLQIPKARKYMPIVAPLMLMAQPVGTNPNRDTVVQLNYVTLFEFRFHSESTFQNWFTVMQKDPETRKVLKLPPLLQEVTHHAA